MKLFKNYLELLRRLDVFSSYLIKRPLVNSLVPFGTEQKKKNESRSLSFRNLNRKIKKKSNK